MIYVNIEFPTNFVNASIERIASAANRMAQLHQQTMPRLGQRGIQQLAVEPPQGNTQGITLRMTPRQRRAFWATNGFGSGIPHIRTHGISEGWEYRVAAQQYDGSFDVYNTEPASEYVEGYRQQPFLAALGWLYAPPILQQVADEGEDIIVRNWFEASDPLFGEPT